MADMCCGHWYLRTSGFDYEAFEEDKIKSCLKMIFKYNVMLFADGKRGAVNGMRPDGQIDITSIQSEEVWIGVTDAVASLMIYEVKYFSFK
jgi:non-lysosomal glucosylceramidase